MTTKFKNAYNNNKIHKEFFITYSKEDKTDQSQLVGASIVEMAKKFGIEAIIAKAEARNIESLKLQDLLYGHDFTKMFKNKEEMLNVKKKAAKLFENVPARMRKELFNDNINEFVNAYTSNDEKKLTGLRDVGLISDTQLMAVKDYNTKQLEIAKENARKAEFISKLESVKGGLYEAFKKTGNIDIGNISNNTEGD